MGELSGDSQTAFQDRCFDGYFTKGVFPDADGLARAAAEAGVGDVVETFLADDARVADAVRTAEARAIDNAQRGITGVPFFFFDGRPAFSGARDVDDFVYALNNAAGA
mmetsp:Transcript_17809/g.54443  ORF Transcript_17809/g.54443 Transcript_17809/m.54443 type:complete len:108 (-) Transcript_17809:290-613(-)